MVDKEQLPVAKDGNFCYMLRFEKDFSKLAEEMTGLGNLNRKICIVTDSNVAPLYLEEVKNELQKRYETICEFILPAGEQNKTLDQIRQLYEYLITAHFDRKDCLVALGGGVVGDMTGFTAATYLRGIDFVQVPTTLLSQVDSSIGGKTGVDFDSYKNMVGAFHMPRLVYMNLSVLSTLNDEQFACGMGEILKHGLIRRADYFYWCMEHREQILRRDYEALLPMILESCRIKRDIVQADPLEQGERALLNFGHTIGHAVEKLKNFELLHGQCVALGCIAALKLSVMRGMIHIQELEAAEQCFESFGLPIRVEGLTAEEILKVSKSDKKMEAGQIKFVLVRETGAAYVDTTVSDAELFAAAEYIIR